MKKIIILLLSIAFSITSNVWGQINFHKQFKQESSKKRKIISELKLTNTIHTTHSSHMEWKSGYLLKSSIANKQRLDDAIYKYWDS